jgi:hypothetical protein
MVLTAKGILAQSYSEVSGSRRMKEAAYLFSSALQGCDHIVGCCLTGRLLNRQLKPCL